MPSEIEAKMAKKEQILLVDVRELAEWHNGTEKQFNDSVGRLIAKEGR